MTLKVPYLSYTEIGKRAQSFLNQFHPSLELPIPIEEIIDLKLSIDIFPFPRLYMDHGLNGYLSRDLTTMYVDEYQYDNLMEKYRYTLAHELGHYVLHKPCYLDLPFDSPEEYMAWRLSIPPEDIEWFEKQGDWFAEQVLVPTSSLNKVCAEIIQKHENVLSKLKPKFNK